LLKEKPCSTVVNEQTNILPYCNTYCNEITDQLTTCTALEKVEVGGFVIHILSHAQLGLADSSVDWKM
jgi:hypothetical protein